MTLFENVFVTVGTTEFDELISAFDSNSLLLELLVQCGCKRLIVQIGRGIIQPTILLARCKAMNVNCEIFRFKTTLRSDMAAADLIISHCGAGSILEAISLEKFLIVVVNSTLQGNHQMELADALARGGYCWATEVTKLDKLIAEDLLGNVSNLIVKPFPAPDFNIFPQYVDTACFGDVDDC